MRDLNASLLKLFLMVTLCFARQENLMGVEDIGREYTCNQAANMNYG